MGFGVDYNKAPKGNVDIGWYEAIIETAEEGATQNGAPYLNIVLTVRNDVDQPCQDGTIYYPLYLKGSPSADDAACNGYSSKQVQGLSRAAELPNGQQYSSIQEWCDALVGRPVRIEVYEDTYEGKTKIKSRYPGVSKRLPCEHKADVPF